MPHLVQSFCQALVQALMSLPEITDCRSSLPPSLRANLALNLPKMPLLKHLPGSPSPGLLITNHVWTQPGFEFPWESGLPTQLKTSAFQHWHLSDIQITLPIPYSILWIPLYPSSLMPSVFHYVYLEQTHQVLCDVASLHRAVFFMDFHFPHSIPFSWVYCHFEGFRFPDPVFKVLGFSVKQTALKFNFPQWLVWL